MNGSAASLRARKVLSALLVVLQFAAMLLLPLLAAPAVVHGPWGAHHVVAALCLGGSLALMLWTLRHNRLGNFNIRPLPKAAGQLVTSGPYRWVRHPMYSAVLLGAAGVAPLVPAAWGWLVWLLLGLVLWLKAGLEEHWLCEQHAHYRTYMQTTRRFVPWVL